LWRATSLARCNSICSFSATVTLALLLPTGSTSAKVGKTLLRPPPCPRQQLQCVLTHTTSMYQTYAKCGISMSSMILTLMCDHRPASKWHRQWPQFIHRHRSASFPAQLLAVVYSAVTVEPLLSTTRTPLRRTMHGSIFAKASPHPQSRPPRPGLTPRLQARSPRSRPELRPLTPLA